MTKRTKILAGVLVLVAGAALAAPTLLGNIIRLERLALASFPAASATNEGGMLYDDTNNLPKVSDGVTWNSMVSSAGVQNAAGGAGCFAMATTCPAGVNWWGGYINSTTGGKVRNIICSGAVHAGANLPVTIEVFNLTDGVSVCSCAVTGICTAATTLTPSACDCNGTLVAGKLYNLRTVITNGCTPSALTCVTVIEPT